VLVNVEAHRQGRLYREEMTHHLDTLAQAGQEKGFEVEQDANYGAGPVDVVWNINVHPALPNIKFGFIALGQQEEGGSQDTEDNQLSLRKIEEAAFRGIRSGQGIPCSGKSRDGKVYQRQDRVAGISWKSN
jgi:hypothetical protein